MDQSKEVVQEKVKSEVLSMLMAERETLVRRVALLLDESPVHDPRNENKELKDTIEGAFDECVSGVMGVSFNEEELALLGVSGLQEG